MVSLAERWAIEFGPMLKKEIKNPKTSAKRREEAKEELAFVENMLILQIALEVMGKVVEDVMKKEVKKHGNKMQDVRKGK